MKQLSSRVVYTNPWMTVREDEIELLDGTTGIYGVIEKSDFAVVLPRGDGGFWMVEQFRYAIGRRAWEFPQGTWTHGMSGTTVELAHAELNEETGLRAAVMERLGRLTQAHGHSTQEFDVFLASGLSEGEPSREVSEMDMIHRFVPDSEILEMARTGALADSTSLAALALYWATSGAPVGVSGGDPVR